MAERVTKSVREPTEKGKTYSTQLLTLSIFFL